MSVETEVESNSEAVNFRMPLSMKEEMKTIMAYRKYSGYGEMFRALYRDEAEAVLNSPGFKIWLKMKEDDKNFTLDKVKKKAKELGYGIHALGQKELP